MTEPISSYSQEQQQKVINHRLSENRGGLGYLSALDARERIRKRNIAVEKIMREKNCTRNEAKLLFAIFED